MISVFRESLRRAVPSGLDTDCPGLRPREPLPTPRRNYSADGRDGGFGGSHHALRGHAQRLANNGVPGARLITIPEAGHILNWEADGPAVLVETIGSFSARPSLT